MPFNSLDFFCSCGEATFLLCYIYSYKQNPNCNMILIESSLRNNVSMCIIMYCVLFCTKKYEFRFGDLLLVLYMLNPLALIITNTILNSIAQYFFLDRVKVNSVGYNSINYCNETIQEAYW